MGQLTRAAALPSSLSLSIQEDTGNGHGALIARAGQWSAMAASPARAQIYNLATGAFGIGAARLNGFLWYEATSAAGSIRSRQFQDLQPGFPGDLSLTPAAGRRSYRIGYGAVIHRAGPLVANAPLGFQISFVGLQLTDGTTASGYGIVSDSTLNGGNWTVVRRLVTGGALVQSLDTGIPGTTEIYARINYEHALNPRLFMEINGLTFGEVTGLANMPVIPGSNDWFITVVQGLSVGGGVGQVDRFRDPDLSILLLS